MNNFLIFLLPTLFAITVHEASHAYAAKWLGDKTAFRQGRCTINPLPHIDPIGTILVPSIALLLGGILFGWAKPVPVEAANLRYPKKSMFWVALAGPASNFFMALSWALCAIVFLSIPIKIETFIDPSGHSFLFQMAMAGIKVNIALMILNLFPLPPLDGAKMVERFLKGQAKHFYNKIEPYGMFILIFLMFTGILHLIWFAPLSKLFSWIPNLVF